MSLILGFLGLVGVVVLARQLRFRNKQLDQLTAVVNQCRGELEQSAATINSQAVREQAMRERIDHLKARCCHVVEGRCCRSYTNGCAHGRGREVVTR